MIFRIYLLSFSIHFLKPFSKRKKKGKEIKEPTPLSFCSFQKPTNLTKPHKKTPLFHYETKLCYVYILSLRVFQEYLHNTSIHQLLSHSTRYHPQITNFIPIHNGRTPIESHTTNTNFFKIV